MRIALAFNLRNDDSEEEAELLTEEDVERLRAALAHIGHDVVPVEELLERFPEGVLAEEFVEGRELTVPLLEGFPGRLLEIVEHVFKAPPRGNGHRSNGGKHQIFDYDAKRGEGASRVRIECPAQLEPRVRQEVLSAADRVFQVMPCPDLGRADFRLTEDGVPVLIEVNPLPSLREEASLLVAAGARGLSFHDVLENVGRTAAQPYGLTLTRRRPARTNGHARRTLRELGVPTGRLPPGPHNAITDVRDVKVGYVTRMEDDVPVPEQEGVTSVIRTGVTAVVPDVGDLINNHLVAGGFVLNGIGEMSGLIQAMEWGWLETPVLLTNTMHRTGAQRHRAAHAPPAPRAGPEDRRDHSPGG